MSTNHVELVAIPRARPLGLTGDLFHSFLSALLDGHYCYAVKVKHKKQRHFIIFCPSGTELYFIAIRTSNSVLLDLIFIQGGLPPCTV